MNRSRGNLVLILCAIYSFIAALYPFELSDRTLYLDRKLLWHLLTFLAVPIRGVRLDDVLKNIVYFLPWGALVYVFAASPRSRILGSVFAAALLGGMVSFAIELSQIFFSRHPSIFDVLANMLGAMLGALVCTIIPIKVRAIIGRMWAGIEQSWLSLSLVVLFGTVPFIVTVSKSPWNEFRNWDRNFAFQLGNEATLDRPWRGILYLVAVYNRALSPKEVFGFYKIGSSHDPIAERSDKHPVALYTFGERGGAEVSDVSGYGSPLTLTLHPTSHFRWLPDRNGIEILQPAILKSEGPAKKLFDAFRTENELSIEVWMKPADLEQKGPARIVSLSHNLVARNFTMGQEGADIDFRLRTPISGANGMAVNLRTQNKFLTPKKVHLVATYKESVERLYVNGREHADNVDLKKVDIIVAFSTHKNLVSQMAYSFVYFFPVSFVFSFVFSRRCGGFIVTLPLPVAIAISLLSMAEVVQAYLFARSVDWALVSYGLVVVMAGAVCGRFLAKKPPTIPRASLSFS